MGGGGKVPPPTGYEDVAASSEVHDIFRYTVSYNEMLIPPVVELVSHVDDGKQER